MQQFISALGAAQMLYEETDGDACITTGVGQHQMWAAQWYTYDLPRRWASSGACSVGHGREAPLPCICSAGGWARGPPTLLGNISLSVPLIVCSAPGTGFPAHP